MIIGFWGVISAIVAIAITAVICGIAGAIIWGLINGTINLTYIIAEPADPDVLARNHNLITAGTAVPPEIPKASLSRLQFLIFTFVVAGVYLVLSLEAGRFVDIPQNVLLLIGISGTSYVVSKGIGAVSNGSDDTLVRPAVVQAPPPPPPAVVTTGTAAGTEGR
jgi:hypothetical protein